MSMIGRMTKLNQVVALEKGVKTQVQRAITDIYHQLQKGHLFDGLTRKYEPRDEEGEHLPDEGTPVQLRAETLLDDAGRELTRLFDLAATKDEANTHARADVVVDGEVLLNALPIPTLLFLEKQLTDLHALISKIPTHDPSQRWELDESSALWRAEPVKTTRSKKVLRNHVKYEATDKHPAQVEVFSEDIVVGDWTRTDFTGRVPAARQRELLDRVRKLQEAVKVAREEANGTVVTDVHIGKKVFDYLLAG